MPTVPYDVVNQAINMARIRLNDHIETLAAVSGKLLENTQPFTQQVVNTAWRRLQEVLANLGFSRLKEDVLLTSVPAVTTTDPAVLVYFDWTGYFDGTNPQAAPVFPQDMIAPLDLWERAHDPTQNMLMMDRVLNGLPRIPKLPWNRQWEWKNDKIYMPGANVITDILLRYAAYLADFVDNSPTASTPWYGQPIPIMRSLDSLALFMCAEICTAREDADGAAMFVVQARAKALLVLDRDTAAPKQVYKASELSKMRDRFTPDSQGSPDPQLVKR